MKVKSSFQYVLYLEKRKMGADGKCSIAIRITHKRKRKVIITRVKLLPEVWNHSRQKVKGNGAFAKKANMLLFARLLDIGGNSTDSVKFLMGHKPCKALNVYRNISVNLNPGTDESK